MVRWPGSTKIILDNMILSAFGASLEHTLKAPRPRVVGDIDFNGAISTSCQVGDFVVSVP